MAEADEFARQILDQLGGGFLAGRIAIDEKSDTHRASYGVCSRHTVRMT
jgi:hypothetical protein